MSTSLADIIAQILAAAGPALGSAREKLEQARAALVAAREKYPDFRTAIDKAIAELDAKIAATDKAESPVIEILMELKAIPGEGFSPARHPGDATGG